MLIYRVETKEGYGPYWQPPEGCCGQIDQTNNPKRPGPLSETWHGDKDKWLLSGPPARGKFAFANPEQFRSWFPRKEVEYLAKFGFELVRYEVPDDYVLVGEHQVMYNSDHAVKIEPLPLLDAHVQRLDTGVPSVVNSLSR